MVTSPYEWKIPEWDEKPQTNKNKRTNVQDNLEEHTLQYIYN